ncbi:Polyprenol reductase 2 [Sesamum angolense]|uniref:Polyprenol reductase 2 n=1 Tax=Sesamum angolense TaxID=2727404 RepID=A0AAE1WY97_9LAMI|nr:Polyprenol reductase 2 [Sesamum angolense]
MQVTEFDLWGHVNLLMHLKWYVWFGAALFSWGWIHQRRCHAILGSLRDNDEKVDDYAIPHGDWSYTADSWLLVDFLILQIWLLFGFVVANLVFAAAETQRWYIRKFDNYPRNRYAVIPFVY